MATSDTHPTPKKTRAKAAARRGPGGAPMTPDEISTAQETFLATYAKRGNVAAAAAAARIHRSTVYEWQEHFPDFAAAYHQAQADYRDALRNEIDRRAHQGVLKPVYGPTKKLGAVREYSDTLLIFQAKAHMPEYRERTRIEMTGADGGPMETRTSLDLSALQSVLLTALANFPEAQYAAAAALAQLADQSDGKQPTQPA